MITSQPDQAGQSALQVQLDDLQVRLDALQVRLDALQAFLDAIQAFIAGGVGGMAVLSIVVVVVALGVASGIKEASGYFERQS